MYDNREQQNDKLPTYSEYIENPEKYYTNSVDGNSKNIQTNLSLEEENSYQPPHYETLFKNLRN